MNNIINYLIKNTESFTFYNYIKNINTYKRGQFSNIQLTNNNINAYNNNNNSIRNYIKNQITIDDNFKDLPLICDNKFISYQITEYIINNIKYKKTIKNNLYNITIYSCNNNNKVNELISEIINIVNFIILILKTDKIINLTIFLTPLKKIYSENLNINNINSGSTNKFNIFIFRKEEILKVIIHELIHYTNYDISHNSNLNELLIKKINLLDNSSYISINESYTEAVTILIFMFYLTIKKCKKFNLNYYIKLLKTEIKWSILQAAKLLFYNYKFNNLNEIYIKNNIYQTTDIFSYYILKTALLYNYKNFFKFLENNTNNLKFINNQNNYNEFSAFIFTCLNNNKFNNIVNNIIKKIKNDNILIKSMKMSYYA